MRLLDGRDARFMGKIVKRLTLTPQEAAILAEICKRFGWSESKTFQIMFVEWSRT